MTPANTPHVIVFDDALELLPIYDEVLAEGGYRVTLHSTVPDDATSVLALEPDLIILDLLVQRQNHGMPFLRSLRATPVGRSVPVIVCSAANDKLIEYEEEIQSLGATVLGKPFDIDDLLLRANESVSRATAG